jgi:hypothetical protein
MPASVEVHGRWNALALSQRLVPYHSYLVERGRMEGSSVRGGVLVSAVCASAGLAGAGRVGCVKSVRPANPAIFAHAVEFTHPQAPAARAF